MPADDRDGAQDDVVRFLSRPETYGLRGDAVTRIDTHISIVWLAGSRAFKLKRAVRFDYVDYSTREKRHAACLTEVQLNRRTAPALYLGVRAITRQPDASLAFDGGGTPVDWVVEMVRFDEDTLFDRLAARRALDVSLMDGLAAAVARLHAQAEPRPDRGGAHGMAWVVDGNAQAFEAPESPLDPDAARRVITRTRDALERHRDRLDERQRRGFVRVCHGDLHLRNICLIDGVPTIFDAVEFNDDISCVDVLYDLAFLLMDLWYRGLRGHASRVLNRYVDLAPDVDGLALLPLFLSCRAAIRSKTSVAASRVVPDTAERMRLCDAARSYLSLADALLDPPAACLVAIGGFSGTGKSTLAQGLAPDVGPAPGALVLRSDVIRKTLRGADPLARLGPEAYAPEASRLVYQTLASRARAALQAGHTVVADAVHQRPEERAGIETVARDAGVPFVGIWLEGPVDRLSDRLRSRTNDASDATPEILARQVGAGAGDPAWHRLDSTRPADEVRRDAMSLLSDHGCGILPAAR